MKHLKGRIALASLLFFVMGGLFIIQGQAFAKPLELKFGHVGNPGSLFVASVDEFAKRANERLGDKGKVITYGASQLGNDRELLQKLKLGTVDFSLFSTVMSSVADEFGLFEMPYLVKDRNHMRKIRDEVFWPKIEPALEKKGYKAIAVWENGFRHVTNNVRPIVTPEDLKDLKLRTPKGEWRVKMFKAYGANPTPMAFSEVFVALQTGVIDGQENPFAQIYSSKFQEVQKYISLTGHVYTPAYVVVSKKHWEKLPADVQKILADTAVEIQEFVYETAEKMDVDMLEQMRSSIEVNEADKPAFIKASKPIYDEFGTTVKGGAEMIDMALKLAE